MNGPWALEVDSDAVAGNANHEADLRRLLRERRAARGWDEADATQALQSPAMRAIAALLERKCQAALLALPAQESRTALALLEPEGNRVSVPAYFATPPGTEAADRPTDSTVWLEPTRTATVGEIAAMLISAAGWLSARLGCPTLPVIVQFAAGKNPSARLAQAVAEHVKTRAAMQRVDLYSGLFYRHGELEATRLLAALRAELSGEEAKAALPVCWSPQLELAALGATLTRAGGSWSGAVLAGAEAVAGMLPPPASAGARRTTLAWIARLAAKTKASSGSGE